MKKPCVLAQVFGVSCLISFKCFVAFSLSNVTTQKFCNIFALVKAVALKTVLPSIRAMLAFVCSSKKTCIAICLAF